MSEDPELAAVFAELVSREPIFHRPEYGTSRADFERMTAPDFWEVGASGRRYTREAVLAELEHRYSAPYSDDLIAEGFACRRLSGEVYLLTYNLLQDKVRRTRRTTIWQRTADGWQIVFHQGTLIEAADYPFDEKFRATLADLLAKRRDVRRFRPDALPAGVIERLLQLACLAPSVGFSQPWRWVEINSSERRASVVENFRLANAQALADYSGARASLYARLKLAGLIEAPVHLAIFIDPETSAGHGLGIKTMPEMLAYSAVCAVNTLWLAARAEVIGVGWFSILEPDQGGRTLEVPRAWKLVAYVCLGYPQEERDRPELESEGWETRQPGLHIALSR